MGRTTRRGNAVDYSFGQYGSIHCAGTEEVTVHATLSDMVFVAIQFLEDTKFSTSAAKALVPESAQLYPSGTGTSTDIDGNAGDVTGTEVFPKGMTIYGRWTSFQLSEGRVIAYLG